MLCALDGCASPDIETVVLTPSGANSTDEITLPTQQCGDYFIVQAMINDRGPFPMVLDTGAGITVISPTISKQVGISGTIERIEIDRFRASGSIPCQVYDVDHLSRALGMSIEGVLAYGVFKGVLLTYDYPKQEIRVRQGRLSEAELTHPGAVSAGQGTRPFVRAALDGIDFDILLDTGSSRGLKLTMLNRFSFAQPPRPTGVEMRIDGLSYVNTGRLENDLELGPLILRSALVNESASVDLIGQRIMRAFVITFDQISGHVMFTTPHGSTDDPIDFPSLYGSGIAFTPLDDRLIVRKVFEDTAAQRARVNVDDEILSINGKAIADLGCDHFEFLPINHSEPMELIINRNGIEIRIDMLTDVLVP